MSLNRRPVTTHFSRVVIFCGLGSGVQWALGFARVCPADALTFVVNVGNDEEVLGLKVCPDLDGLTRSLACQKNRSVWGLGDLQTRYVWGELNRLGVSLSLPLSDCDLGLAIWRSWQLKLGKRLTEITNEVTLKFGVTQNILPATDAWVPTQLECDGRWMRIQDWLSAKDTCFKVSTLRYGLTSVLPMARPSPEVLLAVGDADLIIFAPINPLLSVAPMLALPGLRDAIFSSTAVRVAISPMMCTDAEQKILTKLALDLELPQGLDFICQFFSSLCHGLVIDEADAHLKPLLAKHGLQALVASEQLLTERRVKTLGVQLLSWARQLQRQLDLSL
jgi:LPPG:FO 2-phospho-L-lactate transferase